jgi:hypothetical protein
MLFDVLHPMPRLPLLVEESVDVLLWLAFYYKYFLKLWLLL